VAALEAVLIRLRSTLQDDGEVEGNRPARPPEVELWVEVVARAIEDLAYYFSGNHTDSKLARRAARWLFSPLYDKDLLLVCDMAEMQVADVRAVAKRRWLEKVPEDWKIVQNALWEEVLKS
jgi:hypothetical protein